MFGSGGSGFRAWGVGRRVYDCRARTRAPGRKCSLRMFGPVSGFSVQGSGRRVSCFVLRDRVPSSGSRVWCLGVGVGAGIRVGLFGVRCSGLRVEGVGHRVQRFNGLKYGGVTVLMLVFGAWGPGLRVQGLGFKVLG